MSNSKPKIIPHIKSVLIFALAALAVFQVSQLWFVNITDRNFFLYIQARFAPGAPDGHDAFVRPFRVIYGAGDGYFNMRLSRISETDAWDYGEPMISAVLANGHFVSREPIDRDRILSAPVFIYEYAFAMDSEIFAQAFGQRSGAVLTVHGIENFGRIAVHPPADESSALYAFFMDDEYSWEFTLTPNRARSFDIAPVPRDTLHLVPTNSYAIGFVPVRPPGFSYNPITVTNPYQREFGAPSLSSVRGRIEPFFNNPATINQRPSAGGIYTFSNMNTMVRYLVGDVLEYTSFRPIGTTVSSSFMGDFSAALAFVQDDPYVINEIFLADYEPRGREHIFWFGYVIEDFPLVLTEPWATGPSCQDPLPSPIEVVVDHGRVVRYRRLAHNFHVTGNLYYVFDTALDVLTDADRPFTLGFPIMRGEAMLELEVLGG